MVSDTDHTYDELLRAIRTTRRRWRLKILLRGLAVFLLAGLATVGVSVWALDRFHYGDVPVAVIRALVWIALMALAFRFLVLPFLRRVSDRQVALYIEEHEPKLEAELLSAVELGAESAPAARRATPPDPLVATLVERAIASAQTLDWGASIDRPLLRRFSALAAGSALAGIAAILLSPAFLQHGALLLFVPWKSDSLASPYGIEVLPGTVTVARGSDLEVRARLTGFDSESVELAVRRGEGNWERWPMPADGEPGEKLFMLLDLQEASEYFVEAGGVRSVLHRIEVADLPYVDQIALEYHFPSYTGLSPQRVEEGGDIAALRGTAVRVEVTSTVPVTKGRLMIENAEGAPQPIDLAVDAEGRLTASLEVQRDTFYRVELPGPDGAWVTASPDYAIEVMVDQPPVLSFAKPGRDVRAHKLEEVFTEAHVEDDYGVAKLDLVYSVNGGDEKTITLLGGGKRPKQFDGGHTFYLEELDLVDGDFISYYARASEAGPSGRAASVTSDIYFVEITPFSKNYRQAEQGGSGMQGGQMDNALSLRQRQIVAATFKLVRDRKEFGDKQYEENLTTVALMQGRLREQVETLIQRMQNRLRGEEEFQSIVEDLVAAIAEMKPAEEKLTAKAPNDALPPEQRALVHLQRAEARFRDVQVAFQQGGMPGEQQRMAEDLADLFELELDKLHNQYETVERGERQAAQQEVDEALQRLEELARRQEQENERQRKLPAQMGMSGAAGQNQRQLIEQTEELARQLERLARERSRPDLAQTARRLQQAADSMRRASANRSSGEIGQGTEALEQLREARRLLERNREFQMSSEMDDLTERAERARRMQERITSQVGELPAQSEESRSGGRGESSEQLGRILGEKDELEREVGELESQIDRVARQARGAEKDAARSLSEAAESIRENQLKEKIRYSKGVVRGRSPEYAKRFEEEIGGDIGEMQERLGEAKRSMGGTKEDKSAEALQGARDLVRRLESFQNGLEDRGAQRQAERSGSGEPGSEQGQEQGQKPGEHGEGGEQGAEGERQASQGGQQKGQQGEGKEGGESQGQGQQQDGEGDQSGGRDGRRLADRQSGQQPGEAGEAGGEQSDGSQGDARGAMSATTPSIGQGVPGWYQPGIFTPEDLRQMSAEFDQRVREGQQLRDDLRQLGVSAEDLDAILKQMKNWNVRGINNDPLALESLRAKVIEGLRQFEYRLWRDIEGEGGERLFLAGSDEVPPGYRELVEEYYKNLASKK
ncbi:MAG TPA: DUF4175 family protein [Thermoanaerobaculia bacterium]|nr:DUF4175 family protein [Thermoanaerobaculia bacterium]